MSKSILTLDEINLLINSEELKNQKLYGNLYSELLNIKIKKAITLNEMKNLDKKAINALTHNKKTLMSIVIKEWYAERVSEIGLNKKVKCGLCNTPNLYIYYVRNRINNKLLNVGSHCITKFPNLEGYIEHKQKLNQIYKDHKVVIRRNEFYDHFSDCERIIKDIETYFSTLPILLPYNLYTKFKDSIARIRLIYTTYVNDGKKPFKSDKSSIELFQLAITQIENLKKESESFILKNKNIPLSCRRNEIDWLISNNKNEILQQISSNNGIYSLETIKQIYNIDFIQNNLSLILSKNNAIFFKLEKINENDIIFSFNKFGYQPPVLFVSNLKNFMYNIGGNCIFDKNSTYDDKSILGCVNIVCLIQNLSSILEYIYQMVDSLNCSFLFDEKNKSLILYQKGDKSIKQFDYKKFLVAYSRHILDSDNDIQKFLYRIIKNNNTKWMSLDEQFKYGIDDRVNILYKEQKEIHTLI